MKIHKFVALCALLVIGLAHAADLPKLTLGLISTTSPDDTKKRWQPLVDELAASLKMDVKVVASSNYSEIVTGLKNNAIQVAWLGNKLALDAVIDGKAAVFAQMVNKNGSTGYRSVLITQANSPIMDLGDVTTKPGVYSYADGDPKSTSGHLIPEFYIFARNKLNAQKHFKKMVVGSHQKNFLMVANKEVDIATNNTGDMDRMKKEAPEQYAKVKIFWTSPQISSDPLLYRLDLPDTTKAKVEEFFFSYGKQKKPHQLETLDKILGLSGFQRSTNAQLEPIAKLEMYSETRAIANNSALNAEQKQKATEDVNERLKKLEAVMGTSQSASKSE